MPKIHRVRVRSTGIQYAGISGRKSAFNPPIHLSQFHNGELVSHSILRMCQDVLCFTHGASGGYGSPWMNGAISFERIETQICFRFRVKKTTLNVFHESAFTLRTYFEEGSTETRVPRRSSSTPGKASKQSKSSHRKVVVVPMVFQYLKRHDY